MNKLKYLFLMVMCAGLISGAWMNVSAQMSGQTLVSAGGKSLRQSDVDKLIQFYEWAFQGEFDPRDCEEFQRHTEKEFRANPAESRKTIDDLIKALSQIRALSEDAQAEARKNFLAAFLPEAQKSTDPNARLLLSVYENANGTLPGNNAASNDANSIDYSDDNSNDSNSSYETVKKSRVGNFSSMTGKWVSGNTGSMTTTTSGVYLGGNASRHTYQFSANGAVEYTGIMNMMAGGCRTQIFRTMKGKASLSGETLTINWSPASYSYENSCSASKNYKKTLPAETETMKVYFESYFNSRQLCLMNPERLCMSLD